MAERRLSWNSTAEQQLLSLLFADDQFILSSANDNVQKTAYTINPKITTQDLTKSAQKTKLKAL
jgi:hypothetical protein